MPVRSFAALSLFAVASLTGCVASQVVPTPREALVVAPDVNHAEGSFTGDGDLKLFYQSWRPQAAPPRATLVVVHGLKDHSNHYAALAETLTRQGFAVYAFDLRGHGRSEGKRVTIGSFREYVDDLDTFMTLVREKEPGHPVFLFGHSMGGAIATLYTLTRSPQPAGLLLSGPALKPGDDVGAATIRATKLLGTVAPSAGALDLPNDWFSRDPAVVKDMDTDPLISQGKAPARLTAELLRAMEAIRAHEEQIGIPLLVMHGTADKCTNPKGSEELVARVSSVDKTFKLYPGLYHDLLHEPEKAQVTADLVAWLVAHEPPAGAGVDPKKEGVVP
jgi:alpha-beta hydrolase superfamily lysophospholipase